MVDLEYCRRTPVFGAPILKTSAVVFMVFTSCANGSGSQDAGVDASIHLALALTPASHGDPEDTTFPPCPTPRQAESERTWFAYPKDGCSEVGRTSAYGPTVAIKKVQLGSAARMGPNGYFMAHWFLKPQRIDSPAPSRNWFVFLGTTFTWSSEGGPGGYHAADEASVDEAGAIVLRRDASDPGPLRKLRRPGKELVRLVPFKDTVVAADVLPIRDLSAQTRQCLRVVEATGYALSLQPAGEGYPWCKIVGSDYSKCLVLQNRCQFSLDANHSELEFAKLHLRVSETCIVEARGAAVLNDGFGRDQPEGVGFWVPHCQVASDG